MDPQTGQTARRSRIVPVVVLAATALLIGLVVALNATRETFPGVTSSQAEGPDLTAVERRDSGDPLAAGPVDAPVTLIVFSDYQCPFCARWSHETLPVMMERAEAGELRIEWRDVNVYGPVSERAARASYAAGLQGAFWQYHDALFEDGEKRSEAGLAGKALIALAGELGLDTARFAADLDAPPTRDLVAENARLGLDLGVSSTPVFLMGGQPIVGAQPSQVFVDSFEQALAAAK